MRYHADFFLSRLRYVARAFGTDLVARGRLATVDDVFWLDVEELVHGHDDPMTALDALVAERRAAFEKDATAPPPETLDDAETAGAARTTAPAPPTVPPGVLTG